MIFRTVPERCVPEQMFFDVPSLGRCFHNRCVPTLWPRKPAVDKQNSYCTRFAHLSRHMNRIKNALSPVSTVRPNLSIITQGPPPASDGSYRDTSSKGRTSDKIFSGTHRSGTSWSHYDLWLWLCLCDIQNLLHLSVYRGRIIGQNPEKVFRVFLLDIHSKLYSFAFSFSSNSLNLLQFLMFS
jgi:hypothetical protein